MLKINYILFDLFTNVSIPETIGTFLLSTFFSLIQIIHTCHISKINDMYFSYIYSNIQEENALVFTEILLGRVFVTNGTFVVLRGLVFLFNFVNKGATPNNKAGWDNSSHRDKLRQ